MGTLIARNANRVRAPEANLNGKRSEVEDRVGLVNAVHRQADLSVRHKLFLHLSIPAQLGFKLTVISSSHVLTEEIRVRFFV